MIKLIKTLLLQIINDIDTGNSNISEKQLNDLLELLLNISRKELSKLEAADYIGVSRATFDNYVKCGKIPEGKKRVGFKEKCWNIYDLNKYMKHD